MSTSTQYVRLRNLSSSVLDNEAGLDNAGPLRAADYLPTKKGKGSRRPAVITIIFLVSILMNLVLLIRTLVSHGPTDRLLTYSPAQTALRYKRVVFSSGFGIETSPFQGRPSDSNNKLWASLYDFAMTRLSTEEARPMDNKTLPIPDEGGYVVQLSVFHQLHCLNLVRKGLYGEIDFSNHDELMGIEHLDHCVDMLRQYIMCSSDVTPLTFTRTSPTSSMKVVAEVVHTCRNFPKIQQWAWNRRLKQELDKTTIVTGDPLGWGSYTYTP